MKYYELSDALAGIRQARASADSSAMLRALNARLGELDGYATAAAPLRRRGDGLDRRLRECLAAEIRDVRRLRIAELVTVRKARP